MEYKEIEDDEYSTVTTTNQKLSWVYFIIFMSLLGLVYIYYIDSEHIRKNTSSRRRKINYNPIPSAVSDYSSLTNSGDFKSEGSDSIVFHDFNTFDKYDTFESPSVGSGKTFRPASRNFGSSGSFDSFRSIPYGSSSQRYSSSSGTFRPG